MAVVIATAHRAAPRPRRLGRSDYRAAMSIILIARRPALPVQRLSVEVRRGTAATSIATATALVVNSQRRHCQIQQLAGGFTLVLVSRLRFS